MLSDIRYGLANFWRMRKVVWHLRFWDWTYMFDILHAHLSWQAKMVEKHRYSLGKDRDAMRIRIAALLCKRLTEDDYFLASIYQMPWLNPDKDHPKWIDLPPRPSNHPCYMAEQDLKMFCSIINKYVRYWWD